MSKQAITSRTRVLGVIGDPIEHSLSPLMHNYVLERLGLDYRYVAFHVQKDYGLHVGLAFRTLRLAGLNVTIPYKETVVGQMDVLTEEARVVGAVNTIGLNAKGELVGFAFETSRAMVGLTCNVVLHPAEVNIFFAQ